MMQKQSPVAGANYPNVSKQNRFTCICCRTKFETSELQKGHFKSEWHLYNLKRGVCKLEPIDLDSFIQIQATAPVNNTTFRPATESQIQTKSVNSDDEDDWISIDDDQLLDEDYDEEEAEELLARVIKSNVCLFCDKKSSNTQSNINHMNLMHGFFVPEEQYMIDIEGFMEYLGFKVGAGSTCLWCNQQFTTVHGVRRHMINKDHCKIMYDQEKAEDEFKEFYDYSTQEQIKMKPLSQLAIPKKRFSTRSEHNRSLAKTKSHNGAGALMASKNLAMVPGSYQAKNIKKFNAYRAKIVLRTGMANNQTMRGRLRQQNPI